MSYSLIRQALETRLLELDDTIPIAWENVSFTPPSTIYQRAFILLATTSNPTFGDAHARESGIFQVSVVAPNGGGSAEAIEQAERIRNWFPRGLSLPKGDILVRILNTPSVAPAIYETKNYVIPVSIPFMCDVY